MLWLFLCVVVDMIDGVMQVFSDKGTSYVLVRLLVVEGFVSYTLNVVAHTLVQK